MEIKASDEVIQQTYNSSNKKDIDSATQLFKCQECHTTISGVKLFIKHHENHILKKTTAGSKKDISVSSVAIFNQKKNVDKSSPVIGNNETVLINEASTVNSELTKITNFNEDTIESNQSDRELIFDNSVYDEGDDENYDNDNDNDNGVEEYNYDANDKAIDNDNVDEANCDFLNDLNLSCDEPNDLNDKLAILDGDDSLEKILEDDSNDATDNILDDLKDSEFLLQDSCDSDAQSEDSLASDSSFKNLVEIVKWELEKSDCEENDFKIEANNEGKYTCEVCNLTFEYKFILILHLKKNHAAFHEFDTMLQDKQLESLESENDSYIRCCYCKNSHHTSEFKNHLLECREQYSYNRNILCQICGKMCSLRNLKKHMAEHKKLG